MATLAQTPRTASRAPEKKAEPVRRKVATPGEKAPAYLQKKMALSQPGDHQERQADHVAQQVARAMKEPPASPAPAVQRSSLEPGSSPAKDDQRLARKAVPSAQEVKPQAPGGTAARKAVPEPGPVASSGAAPSAKPATLARKAEDDDVPATPSPAFQSPAPAPAADPASPEVDAGLQSQIEALRGRGASLPEDLRTELEARFDHSFAAVRIHTGPEANRLCTQLHARAFTVGTDLFFAQGAYAPERDEGRELLAHELTHVVQQGGAERVSRAVDPAPSPAPASGSRGATALEALSVLDLPPIKHRHAALYAGTGSRRAAGYARNTSEEQVAVWNRGIELTEATIEQKLGERTPPIPRPTTPAGLVNFRVGSMHVSEPWRRLRSRLLIPDWDRRGRPLTTREDRFQVDHMVELQVFGDTTGNAGNVIGNLELLKGSPNASSGSTIKTALYTKVSDWLTASDPAFAAASEERKKELRRAWLRTHSITFTGLRRVAGREGDDADWWTRAEINAGAPLEAARPEPANRLVGTAGTFVLASGPGGREIARFNHSGLQFRVENETLGRAMAGIRIQEFNLNEASETGTGDSIGSLSGVWDLPNNFRSGEAVTIPLVPVGPYCGAPGALPALNTDFRHLSPISFPEMSLRDGHLYAEGELRPSLPLLANHPIRIVLDGSDIRFEVTFSAGMVSLPIPGLTIDDCSLSLFYSTRSGFGGGGSVEFGITGLGSGTLEANVTQTEGFSAQGSFNFDTELFDQAQVRVWYRNAAFGGEGTLAITTPNKIRGIRSARLTVGFGEQEFHATGDVQPNIPGVQQAGLTVGYSEAEGLAIGGNLQLAPNPAIRSGSVDVTLRKQEGAWKVGATGTAVPAIPGLDSQLTVSYNDGAFLAEFRGAFRRGMLSGTVEVGATNRTLDDQGQPTGEPTPEAPLIVYGSGSATLQIAPWLQATAGLRFAPNGEVTVTGRVGLPSSLQLFARRQVQKQLLNVAVQIPIIPGIVAEVGGNLSATAGFGPGTLEQLELGITYNPAHEEDTTVTGDARFVIPADAGLRLAARAGIGLGITGASATGGLEIGGQLGIDGRAEASAHVEWSRAAGLDLTAQASLSAQPKFKFDVSGYVSVRALGFSVYDNTWQLAAYELGSNLTFGVAFPIHYHEGQPFDVSLDDVTFTVPDVDPGSVIRQLAGTLF